MSIKRQFGEDCYNNWHHERSTSNVERYKEANEKVRDM
jgi:hypothetical protein